MKLLFNKNDNGQEEITNLLGFLSSDFKYDRLQTDIELNTPDLIDLISLEVYEKIVAFYESTSSTDKTDRLFRVLKLSQTYICIRAYYDFAANNDLMHTTAGRKMDKATDESTPWDWQIQADNAALMKRAYKTLDQLILELDKSKLSEWLNSENYKASKSLFIWKTSILNKRYPINNSAQLYFRLVPFMEDFELTEISSRISPELYVRLKESIQPPDDFKKLTIKEQQILKYIEFSIAYLSLGKGYKVFPIEMFPDKINYKENTKMKAQSRAEVMDFLNDEAKKYLLKIEEAVSNSIDKIETLDVDSFNLIPGLDDNTKHVDL